MKTPISLPMAALLAASLAGCGDHEHGACDPIIVVPGTWCITVTATDNTCALPPPAPYDAEFTQAADALIVTSGGVTYLGSLCGSTGGMSGNDPAMIVSLSITFAGDPAAIASGVSTWSGGGCSGRDTFTALFGACP